MEYWCSQRMRPDYKDHYRATAVGYILSFAARLAIVDDYAHDAVLLMDRAMSTCVQVALSSTCQELGAAADHMAAVSCEPRTSSMQLACAIVWCSEYPVMR